MSHQYFDIAIIGGGIVGGALALGFARQKLTVAVIEQTNPFAFNITQKPDVRISAINIASINFLRDISVWETMPAMRIHPYSKLEVWSQNSTCIKFNASELKLPLLGYIIENNVLQLALWTLLKKYEEVKLYTETSLKALHQNNNQQLVTLSNDEVLAAKLVVGADGVNSQVRQMAGIGIQAWQYCQACMLITVNCEHESGNITWQHFTPNGPRAFLPLFDHWASLVWYDKPERIRQLQRLPFSHLQREIDNCFPARLGKVKPISVETFPLIRSHASNYIFNRLILVGDAAHTIHPLAGQGINLGYRDISLLLKLLTNANFHNENFIAKEILKRYQILRMADNLIMQSCMDLFYIIFGNNISPIKIFRNIGMLAAQHAGILKRLVLKYALGIINI